MLKNVAGQNITALLLDTSGDAVTTGTTTVYVTGDAGTQASMGTATHEGNGEWSIDVTQAESNYDDIGFTWVNTGAVTVHQHVFTDQSYDRLGAPAGASVSADIAAIEAQTDDIGAAGAGLTAVPWNSAWDTEVQSEVNDGLVALGLDHLLGAAVVGTDVTDNSIIAKLVSSSATADWDSYVNTTDALQAIRDKQTDIETDTAEIGAAGAGLTEAGGTGDHLTAIDLPNQTMDITGNLSGSVGSVTGAVGSISGITFPTNFSDLSITASTGRVDVASLAGQTAPVTNMELLFDGVEGFFIAHGGPRGPGVYLDDAAANTSTTSGVDGTIANPVSTIAAATTIADALSVKRIYLVNDSDVTAAQTYADYEFIGIGNPTANVFNVGDQIFTNCSFFNLTLEGDCSTSSGRFLAEDCILQDEPAAGTSTFYIHAKRCGFLNSFRVTNNDDHLFEGCYSMVAGNGTPTIDLNSGNSVDVSIRHYSGGIQIDNASATATMSVETDGQVVVDATCDSSFALTVRGNASITDNASLSSLTQDAVYNSSNVNAQVKDVIATDTISELGVGVPSATPTLENAIMLLYMALRNTTNVKTSYTTDAMEVSNDAGTVIAHKDVTDDGSDYSEAKMQSGASS